jgi:ADP-ribose pyrophosphatase YjhB (NUDIX family)
MEQKYKVFINTKWIVLTSKIPNTSTAVVLPLESVSFSEVLDCIKEKKAKKIFLFHHDEAELLDLFKAKLPVVQAGGGLVTNEKGKTLFIYRKGKWDLPKGKIDRKESIKKGAKREVKEETGVKKLKITGLAGVTYHIFKRNDIYQLKETFWYHMTSTYTGELKPELKEGITKVKWKGPKKTTKALKNSYENIRSLMLELSVTP